METWIQNGQIQWPLVENLPWALDMQACMQDPIWHAEGDVWTHTRMVANALFDLPNYQALKPAERDIVMLSALLHDVAKPQTTREEDGRIVSPKHAVIGEQVARHILWDMPLVQREQVCSLIRMHGVPLWSMHKTNPLSTVLGSSLRVPNAWTAMLAEADIIGRTATGKEEKFEQIALFKAYSEEQQCLHDAYTFHNEHSKFGFFFTNANYPAQLFDDTTFEVIILCGLPGSGKDTYAAQLDMPIISLDDIRTQLHISHQDKDAQGRVAQEAYQKARTYAARKQSFIWNSTNLRRDFRQRIIRTLAPYHARFHICYLETSWQNVLRRRRDDIHIRRLTDMRAQLEWPLPTEAHRISYFLDGRLVFTTATS